MRYERSAEIVSGPFSPMQFLELAADDEVLDFLCKLPMVSGQAEDRVTMKDLIYEIQLWPFVQDAWTRIEGQSGIPGRLMQLAALYRLAEAEFERETGQKRRLDRIIDLPTFLEVYTTVGLP